MRLSVHDAARHLHARDATRYKTDLDEVMREVLESASRALRKLDIPCQFADDVLEVGIDEDDLDEVDGWLDDDLEAFGEMDASHAQIVIDILREGTRNPTTH